MNFIKYFIIIQLILLFLQLFNPTKLESYQYCELVFGSLFIIIFLGIFSELLINGYFNINSLILENSIIFASLFSLWYYITKKTTNIINSDSNGVIYY